MKIKKLLSLVVVLGLIFCNPIKTNAINQLTTTVTVVQKVNQAKPLVDLIDESLLAVVIISVDAVMYNIFVDEYSVGEIFGGGFFINSKGHLITNYHVISRRLADPKITIKINGTEIITTAEVLAVDVDRDLALLKLNYYKEPTPYLEFANSSKVRIGEEVFAIGHSLGLPWTVTNGIISAVREVENRPEDVIQTSTPINPGNSGGPLLNMEGKVIGINTFIYSPSPFGVFTGIGFAVTSDSCNKFLDKYRI